jgi:hypothetical protein
MAGSGMVFDGHANVPASPGHQWHAAAPSTMMLAAALGPSNAWSRIGTTS